jgi:transglutaminase-like putative cysteine protease
MGIKVALEHRTSYTFDRLVEVHPHVVRLRPAPHSRTPIEAYSLQVEPADHFVNWQQDAFGNFLARLVFPNRARSLTITVGLIADMKVINPFDFFIEDWAEHIPFAYNKALAEDLKPYLRPVDEGDEGTGPGDLTAAWVKDFSVAPGTRTIDFLVALNRAVNGDVGYSVRMEPGVQTPDHTLRTGIGSCRDSAWLLVSILRQLGYAARFVSGYPARAGSGWTRRRGCSRGRVTSRCRRRPIPSRLRRSPVRPSRARPRWTSPTSSPVCTRTRASRCHTAMRPGVPSARWGAVSTNVWTQAMSG